MDIEFWRIVKSGDLALAERGIQHPAVLEKHFFAQGRAEAHDNGSLDLFQKIGRIKERPTSVGLRHVAYTDAVLLATNRDLHESRISVSHVTQAYECGAILNPD